MTWESQQEGLLLPAWYEPACVVDDAVARVLPIVMGHAENLPYETRISFPADQPGDLAVCCHVARWYF